MLVNLKTSPRLKGSFPNVFKQTVIMWCKRGFKRCCEAWDPWGFVKKDKDRAPVIQSCVYTEIHTILTLTSCWRWLKAACFSFFFVVVSFSLEVNAISWCFVAKISLPSFREQCQNAFFWPDHMWHDLLVYHVALCFAVRLSKIDTISIVIYYLPVNPGQTDIGTTFCHLPVLNLLKI